MRKLLFVGIIALGAMLGLLVAAEDEVATRLVMAVIGAIVGSAIGGALARIGHAGQTLKWYRDAIPGLGVTSDDLAANYWRDQGHPPFMKPPEDPVDPVGRR